MYDQDLKNGIDRVLANTLPYTYEAVLEQVIVGEHHVHFYNKDKRRISRSRVWLELPLRTGDIDTFTKRIAAAVDDFYKASHLKIAQAEEQESAEPAKDAADRDTRDQALMKFRRAILDRIAAHFGGMIRVETGKPSEGTEQWMMLLEHLDREQPLHIASGRTATPEDLVTFPEWHGKQVGDDVFALIFEAMAEHYRRKMNERP